MEQLYGYILDFLKIKKIEVFLIKILVKLIFRFRVKHGMTVICHSKMLVCHSTMVVRHSTMVVRHSEFNSESSFERTLLNKKL